MNSWEQRTFAARKLIDVLNRIYWNHHTVVDQERTAGETERRKKRIKIFGERFSCARACVYAFF